MPSFHFQLIFLIISERPLTDNNYISGEMGSNFTMKANEVYGVAGEGRREGKDGREAGVASREAGMYEDVGEVLIDDTSRDFEMNRNVVYGITA